MKRPAQRKDGGFTLIELLIGLTLIVVTLSIAFAVLRFSARSLERTDGMVRESEETRIALTVVQRLLAQARPLVRLAPQRQPVFSGEAHMIEFIAPMPSQAGRLAGLYHYRLRFLEDGQGTRLLLDHQRYVAGGHFDWAEGHASTILVQGLLRGSFSYFGHGQPQETWVSRWQTAESLPLLVRVQLEHGPGRRAWPELVVPLHAHRVR